MGTRLVTYPEKTAWPAPAKLNLFLHITGQRADGYHELETLFQFIDLQDEIEIEVVEGGAIERPEGPEGVSEEDDLVVRAAHALQRETKSQLGATLWVNKKVPVGGGVGGGSSDAATTLVALNYLWGSGLEMRQLASIGLHLGADVPIFIAGHAAWAEGVGERLLRVAPPEPYYLLLEPGIHVSTAEIFQSNELTRNTPKAKIRGSLPAWGRNDCESVVSARYPEVAEALRWLSQYGDARMTGTGSCLFLALENRARAEQIRSQLPDQWRGYVVKGMNESPLVERLRKEYSGVV